MQRLQRLAGQVAAQGVNGQVQQPLVVTPSASEPQLRLTLIGGGNSGLVCAALIHKNTQGRVRVSLLTSTPEQFSHKPTVLLPDGSEQEGLLDIISADPAKVLPDADVILWTGPVNATKPVFEQVSRFINPQKTIVGTIFAQGLTHILAVRCFGVDCKFFALRNIPWLCRTVERGQKAQIVGPKKHVECVTLGVNHDWVKKVVEPLFLVKLTDGTQGPAMVDMPDFCPIVFNPANQIIHPARYWGLFRKWKGVPLTPEEFPEAGLWLYRGMDEVSGEMLQALDEELQQIKDAYHLKLGSAADGCKKVVPLKERLLAQYGDQIADKSSMAKMVGTNKAYGLARTPVVQTDAGISPAPTHRVVCDDIGWGLCVLVSIADRLEPRPPTTMMRTLIKWHQEIMGKEFLVGDKLVGKDCAELVLLGKEDPLDWVARPPHKGEVPRKGWLEKADEEDESHIGNP